MRPWLPASFVDQMSSWDMAGWNVVEWGAGGSTVWLAPRVAQLWSVEHDPEWVDRVYEALKEGEFGGKVRILRCPEAEGYVLAPLVNPEAPKRWDMALVDGVLRNTCVRVVEPLVDRVLVLDNGLRPAYRWSWDYLTERGWQARIAPWDAARDGEGYGESSHTVWWEREERRGDSE